MDDDDYDELIDTLPDTSDEANPEMMVEGIEFGETMMDALEQLPEDEREILELRFGLADNNEWTLREVAEHLGISHEQVRKLEHKALQTLRRLPIRYQLQEWLEWLT